MAGSGMRVLQAVNPYVLERYLINNSYLTTLSAPREPEGGSRHVR